MKIEVISHKNGKIQITLKVSKDSGNYQETRTITSSETAEQAFYDALSGLRSHFTDICELEPGDVNKVIVTQVKFSYHGDDQHMAAVITARRRLENSNTNLTINAPLKFEAGTPGKSAKQMFSSECTAALRELINQAERFVDGERAQGDLFEAAGVPEAA